MTNRIMKDLYSTYAINVLTKFEYAGIIELNEMQDIINMLTLVVRVLIFNCDYI